jgi:hypothetical protein
MCVRVCVCVCARARVCVFGYIQAMSNIILTPAEGTFGDCLCDCIVTVFHMNNTQLPYY